MFEHTQKAPRELAAAIKRLGIKARLELRDAARILPDGGSDKLLQRELASRKEAGLSASWLSPVCCSARRRYRRQAA